MIDWGIKKALIFDFDGTIANSLSLHELAFIKTIEKNLPNQRFHFDYRAFVGMDTFSVFSQLGCEKSIAHSLTKKKRLCYENLVASGNLEFMPGARALLDAVESLRYRKFLATSGSASSIAKALKALRLSDYFEDQVTANDVAKGKPEPDIYEAVILRNDLIKSECLVIEDAHAGVVAARAAGIDVVGVCNQEISCSVDFFVPKIDMLIDFFNSASINK